MEATGHIQVFLRDRRRILPVRRADVRHEVRLVDLRWLPGNDRLQLSHRILLIIRKRSSSFKTCSERC